MIYPIVAFGDPVLKKQSIDLTHDFPNLTQIISDMWETMNNAKGVGLAAPQIGLSFKLFILDSTRFDDKEKSKQGMKRVFINAEILEQDGTEWAYEEGCLSIPTIRENVSRKPIVRVKYQDENFEWHEETFDGMNARVIQHEYDHTRGILFTELLHPFKKRLIKGKLEKISKGEVSTDYRMKFYSKK